MGGGDDAAVMEDATERGRVDATLPLPTLPARPLPADDASGGGGGAAAEVAAPRTSAVTAGSGSAVVTVHAIAASANCTFRGATGCESGRWTAGGGRGRRSGRAPRTSSGLHCASGGHSTACKGADSAVSANRS
ncbi:MAG: hypothetical protein B7X57_10705 [Erythrobacter sp. 34-65-8]|nr:MAG: hypothetical protein B7X57_10705 [Erythrobacter sp. 34-65-8]